MPLYPQTATAVPYNTIKSTQTAKSAVVTATTVAASSDYVWECKSCGEKFKTIRFRFCPVCGTTMNRINGFSPEDINRIPDAKKIIAFDILYRFAVARFEKAISPNVFKEVKPVIPPGATEAEKASAIEKAKKINRQHADKMEDDHFSEMEDCYEEVINFLALGDGKKMEQIWDQIESVRS
jgi:hypothetical protein